MSGISSLNFITSKKDFSNVTLPDNLKSEFINSAFTATPKTTGIDNIKDEPETLVLKNNQYGGETVVTTHRYDNGKVSSFHKESKDKNGIVRTVLEGEYYPDAKPKKEVFVAHGENNLPVIDLIVNYDKKGIKTEKPTIHIKGLQYKRIDKEVDPKKGEFGFGYEVTYHKAVKEIAKNAEFNDWERVRTIERKNEYGGITTITIHSENSPNEVSSETTIVKDAKNLVRKEVTAEYPSKDNFIVTTAQYDEYGNYIKKSIFTKLNNEFFLEETEYTKGGNPRENGYFIRTTKKKL